MNQFLNINIKEYESPLDLIYHLLEVNHVDIYHIPISEITEQYLHILKLNDMQEIDMNLASEFLVMAATLMQIKSRMLLPDHQQEQNDFAGNDPREELVLRLLAYRRNKYLAEQLTRNHLKYQGVFPIEASSPQQLNLSIEVIEDKIKPNLFQKAVSGIQNRNLLRFNSQNQRIRQLLKKEKFSVKDKMQEIIHKVFQQSRMFFSELFPLAKVSKAERISGFLAILELIRQNRVIVKQATPFAVMMIELEDTAREEIKAENNLLELDLEEK